MFPAEQFQLGSQSGKSEYIVVIFDESKKTRNCKNKLLEITKES